MAMNPTILLLLLLSLTPMITLTLACPTCTTPTPPPPPTPCPPPPSKHTPPPSPPSPKPKPSPSPKPKPTPPTPSPPKPTPAPPPKSESCPLDTLKLGACVDVLGGLVHIIIGKSATEECCPLISGLAGLDAALCLCTTIKAKLLDINILLPIALELLVDCGKKIPKGFQCPSN